MNRTTPEIGRWLAKIRHNSGLSQPQVAYQLGLRLQRHFDDSTLAHWELGRPVRNYELFPALASVLGVTLDELLQVEHTSKGYVRRVGEPPRCKF